MNYQDAFKDLPNQLKMLEPLLDTATSALNAAKKDLEKSATPEQIAATQAQLGKIDESTKEVIERFKKVQDELCRFSSNL